MKLTIFSDIHVGAPHCIDFDLEKEASDPNTYFTGDIFDLKNTKKSELKEYEKQFENLRKLAGDRYIIGNHECMKPKSYYTVRNNVLLCHGHTLVYSDKKVKKWENKKRGKSSFKYLLYRLKHLGESVFGKTYKPSLETKEKCLQLCKEFECDTIVFGHTHRQCDIQYKGIRIINVTRGKTIIDV